MISFRNYSEWQMQFIFLTCTNFHWADSSILSARPKIVGKMDIIYSYVSSVGQSRNSLKHQLKSNFVYTSEGGESGKQRFYLHSPSLLSFLFQLIHDVCKSENTS